MDITQVKIPQYNYATGQGNYNPGRGGVKVDTFIIHWVNGNLALADAAFTRASRVASAHYCIEDTTVHQYVSLSDTSFGAGNYAINQRGINLEHSAQPGRDATDATYETSSQLIVQIVKSLGKKVSDFQFKRHGDIVATQCCGTLDVNRIRNRALAIEASQVVQADVQIPSVPAIPAVQATAHIQVPVNGTVTFQRFDTDLTPYGSVEPSTPDAEVKRMQAFLSAKNFFQDAGAQDGWYGPKTQTAVHNFQIANGITNTTEYGWWYKLTRGKANGQLTINQQA